MRPALTLTGIAIGIAGAGATWAQPGEDELSKALAGRKPGPAVSCIDSRRVDGPQVIDSHTLLYREAGRIWRSDLPSACPGLHDDSRLIVELYGSQICDSDRFRAIGPGETIPGPYCRFGKFVPYDKPGR